jgi:hypothetical protein
VVTGTRYLKNACVAVNKTNNCMVRTIVYSSKCRNNIVSNSYNVVNRYLKMLHQPLCDLLFNLLYTSRESFTHMETPPLPLYGAKFRTMHRERSLSCNICCKCRMAPWFFPVSKDHLISLETQICNTSKRNA